MPHATRPGDVLGDRYRLVDLLTESDGGRFWRAHDPVLERHVAIHVIAADDERGPALMEAARHSATVHDRRVLRVLDAEVTDEVCYVVNEWGWGTSLDILVASTGALGPRRAAWLTAEVADSLATAHAAGVSHGRLNPENVLIDRFGGIRIIGLCVDAALHGVPAGDPQRDVEDLAGLLYCALTTRWAGPSGSAVAAAPRAHGEVLRPRQVRAGVPRPLDSLCDEVLHHDTANGRHRELGDLVTSARGIEEFLVEFVGDATGMPEALRAVVPDVLPEEEQVVLPPVPELKPYLADEPPAPEPAPEPEPESDDTPSDTPADTPPEDRPTEAGVPIFGDDDDVSWLERRTTPAPPPPPFEEPPERPLFAPEPVDGGPVRKPRPGATARRDDEYWPWDTGTGAGALSASSASLATVDEDPVPGRTFLRLATALAAVVLVVLAVVVAINLGRGKTALGGDPDPAPSPRSQRATSGAAAPAAAPLTGLTARPLDPQGGTDERGVENDDAAPLAVDGDPATAWTTVGYNDQLGPPPGLKTGVGLVIDLDGEHTLDQAVLSFVGSPTSVSLYVTGEDPSDVAGLDPVAQGTADEPRLTLDLGGATGTHLVVWLTSLPQESDGRFRGSVAEVVVRGE